MEHAMGMEVPGGGHASQSQPTRSPYENRNVRYIMMFSFCNGSCLSMWNTLLLPLILGQDGRSKELGICTSIGGVAQIASACGAAWLARLYTLQKIIRIAAVVGMTALLILILVLLRMGIRMSLWSPLSFWFWLSVFEVLWGSHSGLTSTSTETLFADSVSSGKRTAVYNTKWIIESICYIVGYGFALAMLVVNGNAWSDASIGAAMFVGLSCHFVALTLLFVLRDDYTVPGDALIDISAVSNEEEEEVNSNVSATDQCTEKFQDCNRASLDCHHRSHAQGAHATESLVSVMTDDCIDGVERCAAVAATVNTHDWPRVKTVESTKEATVHELLFGDMCRSSSSSNNDLSGENKARELPRSHRSNVNDGHWLHPYEEGNNGVIHVAETMPEQQQEGNGEKRHNVPLSSSTQKPCCDLLCDPVDYDADNMLDATPDGSLSPIVLSVLRAQKDGNSDRLAPIPEGDIIIEVNYSHDQLSFMQGVLQKVDRVCSWSAVPYLVCASDMIIAIGSGATVQYFTLFFVKDCLFTPVMLYVMYILSTCTSATISGVIRRVAERYTGRMPSIIVVRFTGALAQLLLSQLSPSRRLLVACVFILRNACMNSTTGLSRSVIMDAVPRASRARWSAFESLCTFTWAGSAAMGGYLVALHGYQYAFCYTASVHFVAIAILVPAAFGARKVEYNIHRQSS